MIPSVNISKSTNNTGVVKPSADGILAIIAPSQSGTAAQPSAFTRQDLALAAFGYGALVEAAAYDMAVAEKPVLLIKAAASTAGANGTVTHTGPGTSAVTATGTPYDDYQASLTFIAGGTIGVAGITFKWSLDGLNYSGVTALGTANTFTIPNSGVTFSFGVGTILAGQVESFSTTGPRMNNSDLVTALEALRTYTGAWDALLVAGADADATFVSTLDAWLAAREAEGKYRTAVINAVPRASATQTEAQYQTAMSTAWASAASTRVVVCADAGDLVSVVRGIRQSRAVAWGVAARGMRDDISVDAAYVGGGPVDGYVITDDRGNPKYHDELLYPGLDDLRLTVLRSVPGRDGVYINNPNLISSSGNDFVYWQHARVMNRACEIVFQLLTARLSKGVRKDVKTGFILEEDAQEIEGEINAELDKQLVTPKRVSGAAFILSRTDDLSSNAGATLNGEVQVSALAYVKKFAINAKFVKTITVSAA